MSDEEKKIQELVEQLDLLSERQSFFQREIQAIKQRINELELKGPQLPKSTNTLDPQPNLKDLPQVSEENSQTSLTPDMAFAEKIKALNGDLEQLSNRHTAFQQKIHAIRKEIYLLEEELAQKPKTENTNTLDPQPNVFAEKVTAEIGKEPESIKKPEKELTLAEKIQQLGEEDQVRTQQTRKLNKQFDFEKFIGENLISKIGIAITVIGVGIGAKYAIDHDMINPLTRIILGYLMGLGLLGTGIYLKKKYENFSAVLLSGGMAIMYFITFFAYDLYELIPRLAAFALMVLFTIFTVLAALNYNKQIIALIGLAGAYCVPLLLNDGSGNYPALFTYMTVINLGILAVAVHRYWKILYYSAFGLTWLVFLGWFANNYTVDEHTGTALGFSLGFFLIFYATFISYKLLKKESFNAVDVILMMGNAFIYYGIGYAVMDQTEGLEMYLGLFTVGNAAIHLGVNVLMKQMKLADKPLFYLMGGLSMVFVTIAIPVQLDGNWVTLLWAGEATLLLWIARNKQVPIYEKISYPIMILAFFSIIQDWGENYIDVGKEDILLPLLNIQFLSSVLFTGFFVFITWMFTTQKPKEEPTGFVYDLVQIMIPSILLASLFCTFGLEIYNYWENRFYGTGIAIATENSWENYTSFRYDADMRLFGQIWVINYALLFIALLSFANMRYLKNKPLANVTPILNIGVLLIFLTGGLDVLSDLRESYLAYAHATTEEAKMFSRGIMHLAIRYISIGFASTVLFASYQYSKQQFLDTTLRLIFEFTLHGAVLWILSAELIHWMDLAQSEQSYKLGLSILWGVYSLFLIVLGIWKRKPHLRFAAMGLFGITLLKLFFYDLTNLNTLAKTIVFVCLGLLLLIISFLYNKFKNQIADEKDDSQ
ncbi:MAG: DUF2339 domain-containing protein [Flammeovirgaceae bacterium]